MPRVSVDTAIYNIGKNIALGVQIAADCCNAIQSRVSTSYSSHLGSDIVSLLHLFLPRDCILRSGSPLTFEASGEAELSRKKGNIKKAPTSAPTHTSPHGT